MNRDEGLIRPVKRKTDPEIGPDAIMAMIPSDLEFLLKLSREKVLTRFDMHYFNLYQILNEDKSLSLSGPFLGAPQSVMGMEKLIVLGAKRIWALGWCGSLRPDLRIGDLIIPVSALSEEGTSRHYPVGGKDIGTDKELNGMIEHALRKKGKDFSKGTVWTTDAPYRETCAKVQEYMAKAALAVEMEMSALMTLGIYRNVKLAALLTVSDELFNLKWNPGFSSPGLKKGSRAAGKLILEIVESLKGKNG